MARRIKEEPEVHRNRIAEAAQKLFNQNGIDNTSVDSIAKEAGYSKATLYVYFKNKEEIVGYLVLNSMKFLKKYLTVKYEDGMDFKLLFMTICEGLANYQEKYPYYFSLIQKPISIDFDNSNSPEEDRETYDLGEEVNDFIMEFLSRGIRAGVFKDNVDNVEMVFTIWGSLCGVIEIAANKEAYIINRMNISKNEFLHRSFEVLYEMLRK